MTALKRYIFTACSLCALLLHAETEVSIHNYNTTDGLPSNYVINMVQDPSGFLWIATHNGLTRYDGYHFLNFSHDQTGPSQLPHSNIIRHIDISPTGLLWIRFYGDVYSCYDTDKRRFVTYTSDGTDPHGLRECKFTRDGDTWLWMRGSGALRVTGRDGRLASHMFCKKQGNLPSDMLNFVAEDPQGHVWIGTDNGVARIDGTRSHAMLGGRAVVRSALVGGRLYMVDAGGSVFRTSADATTIEHMTDGHGMTGITEAIAFGRHMLVLTRGTTWEYAPESNTLMPSAAIQAPNGYSTKPESNAVVDLSGRLHHIDSLGRVTSLQVFPHSIMRESYGQAKVTTDSRGRMWVTTQGNGLFVHDMKRGTTHHITTADARSGLQTDNIFNHLIDDKGNLWIAYDNMGIARVTPAPVDVERIGVDAPPAQGRAQEMLSARMQPDGRLLATNRGHGVYSVDAATGTMHQVATVGDDNARATLVDHEGTLWIGTDYSGLRIGDRWYRRDRDDPTSLGHNHVMDIAEDSRHRVWVACGGGGLNLAVRGSTGYTFSRFFDGGGLNRKVTSIYQCRHGQMFVGTDRGIIGFDPDSLLADSSAYATHFDTNRDNWFDTHAITELADGRVVYATVGAGVYLSTAPHRTGETLDFRRLTTADGLPDPTCQSMATDRQGFLWIGTQWGLARMNPATCAFNRVYPTPDHQGNIFASGGAVLLDDGRLLFATYNGLVVFDPLAMTKADDALSAPTVTAIHADGQALTDIHRPASWRLHLTHRQNTLTFHVSCLDYGNEQTTEYAFRLKGEDSDWSRPSQQNFITYSHLSPGTYTLMVRSRNTEQTDGQAETSLTFTIDPPLWATWWARLFYVLVAAMVVAMTVHNLRTQYRLRRTLELERHMTEFKSEFFMNISHELRTPLMLIQGSVERMSSLGLVTGDAKQPVKNLQTSVGRLLRLISQLLTFNKLQSDRLHLRLQVTDVVRLTRQTVQSFGDTAATRRITLTFTPTATAFDMPLDRDMFDKMLYNLLSNAMKYTPDGGSVGVTLRTDAPTVTLSVADTGIGIKPAQKAELFSRFARSTVAADSIGIGLNLTYQLARLHHGTLSHDDNPAGGSIFTIALPAGADGYQPDDWATDVAPAQATTSDPTPDDYSEMPPVPLNDRRMLIAEDDADIRRYLERELGRFFVVTATVDGQAAYEELKRQKPHIIVSDLIMPRMDGIELLKKVRADDDTFDIPFVMLTAQDDARHRMQGVKTGADSYMPKPVSIGLLATRCLKLLEQYERLRQHTAATATAATTAVAPLITTDQDKRFRQVLDAKIEARLSDPRLSIDQLAESMNYRHSQFFNRVKEVTGMTPGEYIRRIKMERALHMLEDETVTISEVAYQLGFSDPLYFGRCFKQQYGMTPSQYRRGQKP